MHIDIVPNRNSKPAVLLRESYRDGKAVRKRTLANLSSLPLDQVEALRRILKGERLVTIDDVFETVFSLQHGHVCRLFWVSWNSWASQSFSILTVQKNEIW